MVDGDRGGVGTMVPLPICSGLLSVPRLTTHTGLPRPTPCDVLGFRNVFSPFRDDSTSHTDCVETNPRRVEDRRARIHHPLMLKAATKHRLSVCS